MKVVGNVGKWSRMAAVALGTLCSVHVSTHNANAASFSWVWGDDFSGALSSSKWNVYNGNSGASSNCYFLGSNAWTANGILYLNINTNSNPSGRRFSGAGVDTYYRWEQQYGKWEVRAKFPKGWGVGGYVGLFPKDGSWPPEIDFAEVQGREYWACHFTQHYDSDNKMDHYNIWNSDVGSSFDQWHTYALEWTPGTLKYYVDGRLFLTQPQRFTTTTMKLAMGAGTGDNNSWTGSPDQATYNGWPWPLGNYMAVDYVNIYKYNP
jgi:beta-glucanase (GH16 family)